MPRKQRINNLKELMQKAGLSRKQLSKLTETPERTLQNWELDNNTPPNCIYAYLNLYMAIKNCIPVCIETHKKPSRK